MEGVGPWRSFRTIFSVLHRWIVPSFQSQKNWETQYKQRIRGELEEGKLRQKYIVCGRKKKTYCQRAKSASQTNYSFLCFQLFSICLGHMSSFVCSSRWDWEVVFWLYFDFFQFDFRCNYKIESYVFISLLYILFTLAFFYLFSLWSLVSYSLWDLWRRSWVVFVSIS